MNHSGYCLRVGGAKAWAWNVLWLLLATCILACPEDPDAPDKAATPAVGGPGPTPAILAGDTPAASSGCRQPTRTALVEHLVELRVNGEVRQYILDAPPSTSDDPRPLLLAFHGFGDSAAGFRRGLRLHDLGQRERVIVVHAHGHEGVELLNTVGRGWDLGPTGGPDQAFVEAILAEIESTRCVDRRRIFATGFSNGGLFSNLLACTLGDRLAAVVPVGGAAALPDCTPRRPVPILLLHGHADRVIDPAMIRRARNWWAAQNSCQAVVTEAECVRFDNCIADVVHCEGPQAHRWPRDGIARMWRFFAAHPLPGHAD